MLYGRTRFVCNQLGRWRYVIMDRRGHELWQSDISYSSKDKAKLEARKVTNADPSPPAAASTAGGTAHLE